MNLSYCSLISNCLETIDVLRSIQADLLETSEGEYTSQLLIQGQRYGLDKK